MQSGNALDKSLKHFRNVGLKFLHFTSFEDLNEFWDEHNFFGRVGERPVLDEPVQQEQA